MQVQVVVAQMPGVAHGGAGIRDVHLARVRADGVSDRV